MTSDVTDAPASIPDLIARADLDATYQHIALLHRKRDLLRASQIAAEEQFLHRIGTLFGSGQMSEVELALMYRAYAELAVPGFLARWQAAIPVTPGRVQYILRHLKTFDRHAPNMPDGTWRGVWPLGNDAHVPMYGACVVYVLYDEVNEPCYVGSTQNLKARLKDHHKDQKPFTYWTAFACADRETAYLLEEKLLSEHQPYLNKKRYR